MDSGTTVRIARPTDDLEALLPFYREGLGLELIYRFEAHDGFDGIMLGRAGAGYHFEFTRSTRHRAGRAPSQEHLIVFYLEDEGRWREAVARMRGAGFEPVAALNPYWDRQGCTFEDPDGYRVVLQQGAWPG